MNSTPQSAVSPIKNHPVFRAALAALIKGRDEAYMLDDQDIEALAFGLVKHHLDPTLPPVILALIGLAVKLHHDGSPTAGAKLLTLLARIRPKLTVLRRAPRARERSIDCSVRRPRVHRC